jgi:chemotaxis protein methyltransferase CheR
MTAALTNPTPYEREFDFSDTQFEFIATFIRHSAGIQLPAHKKDMVYGRLARRLRALHLDTFEQYLELLKANNSDETARLINAITTNHTRFFREPHHFEHLRGYAPDYGTWTQFADMVGGLFIRRGTLYHFHGGA